MSQVTRPHAPGVFGMYLLCHNTAHNALTLGRSFLKGNEWRYLIAESKMGKDLEGRESLPMIEKSDLNKIFFYD